MAHKLIEEIVDCNNWRDGDFAKFKTGLLQADEQFWCRMCVPMIYAHWEGFVVSSIKEILKHLNELKLKPENVPTHLVVHCLGDSYKSLSGKQNFQQRVKFTEKFSETMKSTMEFQTKVESKSNLNSKVLKNLCEIFDFNYAKFSDVLPDIDRLVNVRNSIAHGENSFLPDAENINLYISSVKSGMDILLGEISTFIENESYLENTAA